MPIPTPTTEQMLQNMRQMLGEVPAAIVKSIGADPALIGDHVQANRFAMPADDAALDINERRAEVATAAAAATGSGAER